MGQIHISVDFDNCYLKYSLVYSSIKFYLTPHVKQQEDVYYWLDLIIK